ncbi:nucleoredoxin-like [Lycorma delicatula]|uniref:nucleoredoxin-like n=1 Tax=Lycorma delicatula TaxID=130591 RepID=UPI003F519A02
MFELENELTNKLKEVLLRVPWFALPLQHVKQIRLLCRYEARDGSLILLNGESGNELTRCARDRIFDDPEGVRFPWSSPAPPTAEDIKKLLTRATKRGLLKGGSANSDYSHLTESKVQFNSLEGVVIGLYFSAHWCPPCKAFTRQLIKTYRKIKDCGKKFQIIFVSSDRSRDSFETYLATMPWLALPYDDRDTCQELAELFDVHGIPTLVILNHDLSVITLDGRGEINDDPEGKFFPWQPSFVNILTGRLAKRLQYSPTVVLFLEGKNEIEDFSFAKSVLTPAAEWVKNQTNEFDVKIEFFVAFDNDVSEFIRDNVRLDDDVPLLALIDFPANRISVMEYAAEITEVSVKKFVGSFLQGTLPYSTIGQV